MKLGLQIPDYTWAAGPERLGPGLAEIARAADEAGFEYIGVPDHLWQVSPWSALWNTRCWSATRRSRFSLRTAQGPR